MKQNLSSTPIKAYNYYDSAEMMKRINPRSVRNTKIPLRYYEQWYWYYSILFPCSSVYDGSAENAVSLFQKQTTG